MCETIDEIQEAQLSMVLTRASQQRTSNKPKEKPLAAVA